MTNLPDLIERLDLLAEHIGDDQPNLPEGAKNSLLLAAAALTLYHRTIKRLPVDKLGKPVVGDGACLLYTVIDGRVHPCMWTHQLSNGHRLAAFNATGNEGPQVVMRSYDQCYRDPDDAARALIAARDGGAA